MQSFGMEFDDLVEISRGRVLYVLEWNSEDADADGKKESFAIVVMRRAGGCLLALPQGFLSPEELSSAEVPGEMLGPSHSVLVQGVVMEDGIQTEIGAEVPVLLVDMDQGVAHFMKPPEEVEDLAHMFLPDDPFAFPKPDELVAKALEWLQSLELTDVEWYPTEVTASSGAGTPKRKAAPKRPKAAAVGDTALGKEKQKKATTATLAASLESVLETLPVLTEQMHEMMVRQKSLEEQVVANRTPAGVLTQPLSAALHATPKVAAMAKSFGSPPRVQRAPRLPVMRGGDPAPVLELQGEKKEETSESDVARAMLAQSSALTTLVAHLAGSQLDPMQDLQGVTSGTRGASGGSSSGGVGSAARVVLSLCRALYGEEDVSDDFTRCSVSSVDGLWNHRGEVLRKIRRVWKAEGLGPGAVPIDGGFRLSDVRELGSCERHGGFAHRDDRASSFGFWQVRPRSTFDPSRGSSSKCLYKQTTFCSEPSKSFQSACGPKVGHSGVGVPEGARHDLLKASGADRPGFFEWRRAADPSWNPKGQRRKEEEKERQRRKKIKQQSEGGWTSSCSH